MELIKQIGSGNNLITGMSYNLSNARRFKSNTNSYDIGRYNEKTDEYSFYLNGNAYLTDQLNIVYGGRYTNSSFYCRNISNDITNDNFSSRAGIVYELKDDLLLKLLYGESFRVPTFFEKEVASANVLGSPDLEPEESCSWDIIATGSMGLSPLTSTG